MKARAAATQAAPANPSLPLAAVGLPCKTVTGNRQTHAQAPCAAQKPASLRGNVEGPPRGGSSSPGNRKSSLSSLPSFRTRVNKWALKRAPHAVTTRARAKPREGFSSEEESREDEAEREEEEEEEAAAAAACVAHADATNAAVPVRSVTLCDWRKVRIRTEGGRPEGVEVEEVEVEKKGGKSIEQNRKRKRPKKSK